MSTSSTPAPAPPSRLVSLDALRGFDMFWILGADAVLRKLSEMSEAAPLKFLAIQVEHKAWSGLTFYDLIFPLFLFIVGVSLVFSVPRTVEQHGRRAAVQRILLRGGLLFLLGIFYNGGLTNPWPDVRLAGVLQRIAVCYAATGLLFCFLRARALTYLGIFLLVGYWALLTLVPIRGAQLEQGALPAQMNVRNPTMEQARQFYFSRERWLRAAYEPGLNLANHLDFEYLPGRKYDLYWDPEGLLSTLPAIGTCLLGVLAGLLLRHPGANERQKVRMLATLGVTTLVLGWLWHLQFPVVKKIWTSSYVLVTGGWSLLLLAGFHYVVDVRQWRGWCLPFIWIGMNPITLYLVKNVLRFPPVAQRLVGGDVQLFLDALAPGAGALVIEITALGLTLLLAWFLHRRQIFLRV